MSFCMSRLIPIALLAAVPSVGLVLPPTAEAAASVGPVSGSADAAPPIGVILAYVDPGAAGFVIVTVLGFFAAIGYTARAYLTRMKQVLFRRGSGPQEGETPDPSDV